MNSVLSVKNDLNRGCAIRLVSKNDDSKLENKALTIRCFFWWGDIVYATYYNTLSNAFLLPLFPKEFKMVTHKETLFLK